MAPRGRAEPEPAGERPRLYFYPKIFGDYPVKNEPWDQRTVETFSDRWPVRVADFLRPPLLFALLFAGLGWLGFCRHLYRL